MLFFRNTSREADSDGKAESDDRFRALSPARTILAITQSWFLIAAAVASGIAINSNTFYLFSIFLIGSGQHGLAILIHEGAHRLLFRNRRTNDLVAQTLLSWPLFAGFHNYRQDHLKHHKYLNTGSDPDWNKNRPDQLAEKTSLSSRILHLLGVEHALTTVLNFTASGKHQDEATHVHEGKKRAIYYAIIFSGLCYFGILDLFLLYWMIPYFCIFYPLMRFRGIMEHWIPGTNQGAGVRTVILPQWLGFALFPHNIGYHVEHHREPAIPFYNLPDYRFEIMSAEADRVRHEPGEVDVIGVQQILREIRNLLLLPKKRDKRDMP
jgi:fatty acid desaturase